MTAYSDQTVTVLHPVDRQPARWDASRISPGYWALAAALPLLPAVASDFVLQQIMGSSFILGMVALSLMFLGGYGGMVSMAQMSVAGVAAYMVSILGASAVGGVSLGWPWWLYLPVAIFVAMIYGTLIGALAARTAGIYTIMITLAIATAYFYFVRQNYVVFNGFNGFSAVFPPLLFGVNWHDAVPFYYLVTVIATLAYLLVLYVSRAPFGLALQGVRDNPRRMAALGFNVIAHRVAAFTFASFIAAVAGVLLVWLNNGVSPGAVAVGPAIDTLIIAVVGGMRRPIGPFIGALIFVLLRTFAIDIFSAVGLPAERFQLLVGLGFLAIVFWSDDGVLGLWDRWRSRTESRDLLLGSTGGNL